MADAEWLNGKSFDTKQGRKTFRFVRADADRITIEITNVNGTSEEVTYDAAHLGFYIQELPLFLTGEPAYSLENLNRKLANLLGDTIVDDVTEPYRKMYENILDTLRSGGPSLLFDRTWQPQ